jgi:DNA-binding beta-propeller fold protein YncE
MKKLRIIPILTIFLLSLIVTVPVYAWTEADEPVFIRKIPNEIPGQKTAYFRLAYGVSSDSNNNIYITDNTSSNIIKLSENGDLLKEWGSQGTGDGQFYYPYGVAIDSSDQVYVTGGFADNVHKFSNNGVFISKWGSGGTGDGQFNVSYHIAFDSSGNIYVTDNNNHRVQKFNSDGNYLLQWGSNGSADGQFTYTRGIDIYNDEIYVVDGNNHRVQKFDTDGNFIGKWGSNGSGNGQFDSPRDIGIDSTGNVFIADSGNHRIQKLDTDGNYLYQWGSEGYGVYEFDNPLSIEIDTDDRVIVGDYYSVKRFDNSGNFQIKISQTSSKNGAFVSPVAAAFDSYGNYYVVDRTLDRVQKFDASGNFIMKWGNTGTGDGQFDHPCGVVVSKENKVFVAECQNNRIQKFDSNGNFIAKWGSSGNGNGQFNYSGNNALAGMAFDSSGYLYVTDLRNDRVQKFDSDGNFITKWGEAGIGDGQFGNASYAGPTGLAIDKSDRIYVVDRDNKRIQVFDTSGNFLCKWGEYGTEEWQLYYPQGLGIDSFGDLIIVEGGTHYIKKFDKDGNFIISWGTGGNDNGEFRTPRGLAVGPNDEILVADMANSRVQLFMFDRNPPVIMVDTVSYMIDDRYVFSGTVVDELTSVTSVEFQVGQIGDDWEECEASDGSFDELEEEFICYLPDSYVEGDFTIYVRATDSRTNTNSTLNTGSEYDIAVVTLLPVTGGNTNLYMFVGLVLLMMFINIESRHRQKC